MAAVLVLSSDVIGARMAGTGIRYWNLARVLTSEHDVTLAAPSPVDLEPPDGVALRWFNSGTFPTKDLPRWQAEIVSQHEIVVCQDIPYYHLSPETLESNYFAVDLYAPAMLEKLEGARAQGVGRPSHFSDDVRSLNRLLRLGDFFFCATERQRDFWLGALAVSGRIELDHASLDPELRTLIDCVPFGLESKPPERTGPGPRTLISGIGSEDLLLVWNGGLWSWLDPFTVIRAVAGLTGELPQIRLLFMGSRRPSKGLQELEVTDKAMSMARDLGVLDRYVFFNDWVAYEERHNWLMDADAAITLHIPTAEARLAFRTRVLDLIWTRLPVIAAAGDVLADTVETYGIGRTIDPGDTAALQQAIRDIADGQTRDSIRAGFDHLTEAHTWERAAEPLLKFCRNPDRVLARDRSSPQDEYIHRLELLYTETAEYARHLEGEISRQRAGIEASLSHRVSQMIRRILPGAD